MIKKTIAIELETGLEARPVAMLVQVASQYDSNIYVECGTKRVNAKSIMGLVSLGMLKDEEVSLQAEGPDEQDAVNELAKMIGQ